VRLPQKVRGWRPGAFLRWARGSRARIAAIIVVVVLVVAGSAYGVQRWSVANYKDLEFIGFDRDRVLMVESKLAAQAADYIRSQFEAAGLTNVAIEEFDEVEYEVRGASLQLVHYINGPLQRVPDPRQDPVAFTHKVDFIVQGFSGSLAEQVGTTAFLSDLEYVKVEGNGTEASMYASAAGKVAIVDTETGVGNAAIFDVAHEAGVAAIILHNVDIHENIGYPPIFKGNRQPESWPDPSYPDIPFLMVSKACGDTILGAPSAKLRMHVDCDIGIKKLRVVVGEIRGSRTPERLVVIGAHSDCTYVGPGVVDNGSGTTTVIELAYQLAKRKVDCSIRFCAFAGEEDGLLGSFAYTEAHKDELQSRCRAMLNFDMPHVNLQRGNQGTFTPDKRDRFGLYQAIVDDVYKARPDLKERFSYTVALEEHPGEVGSDSSPFALLGIETSNCWGSGSWEYHTTFDDLSHFVPEGLEMAVLIGGSYALWLGDH
jgi:hypothetical protein